METEVIDDSKWSKINYSITTKCHRCRRIIRHDEVGYFHDTCPQGDDIQTLEFLCIDCTPGEVINHFDPDSDYVPPFAITY